MTINYKVRDIKGTIYDVEIEKDKTVKDFKETIADVIQDDSYRCDLINVIYNQNVIKDDNQTIESIGAEEDACFAISKVPTISINFVLPSKQKVPDDLNLKLDNFIISKECTSKNEIVNALCYQYPELSSDKIEIFSDHWEALNQITVKEGETFGLCLRVEGYVPLMFSFQNLHHLFVLPSSDALKIYESDIANAFSLRSINFNIDGNKLDLNNPISTYKEFADITISERSRCLLL